MGNFGDLRTGETWRIWGFGYHKQGNFE